ncbi:serine acetyltransferase [Flavobacterium sp.]|jgi:serine O-acetyltransferase|uniref:serine O-acetyltransferase n=1 Tax=Flavobacterium sp. TaxID=239 RepID=UPI003341A56D
MSPPVILYRLGHFFCVIKMPLIGKIVSYINRLFFSIWLPSSANIGKNFTVGYWGLGIVIHSDTIIGNNCQINQNVTVGRNFGDKKVPVIGDDVYIGAGSVVFGEINIGNNVIIGSNSLVNKDIPNNSTVVGNPMRIIQTNRPEKYYELNRLK